MKCPRCELSMLDERERDGVTIDVCQKCRGVWLDRGEMEKLIARATLERDAVERRYAPGRDDDPDRYSRSRGDEYRDDDDDRHPDGRRRKRGWLESLTDIFD